MKIKNQSSLLALVAALIFCPSALSASVFAAQFGGFYSVLDGKDSGVGHGGGVIFRSQIVGILGADARIGYLDFERDGFSMIPLEAAIIARAPVPFLAVYGGLGGGVYFINADRNDYENQTGFFPVLGAEFKVSELVLFAEGRYLFLKADRKSGIGQDDLTGPGFNLGLSFHF
ncbi:MAG: hypothetical protein ACFCU4_01745 [Puniceicoccaceae bacterium]